MEHNADARKGKAGAKLRTNGALQTLRQGFACAVIAFSPCARAQIATAYPVDCKIERRPCGRQLRPCKGRRHMNFIQKYGVLIASAVLGSIVGAAGIARLMGVPMVHQIFGILGLPS